MGNRKHNHCSLSQEAIEWINGELLGDGHLRSHSLFSARLEYTSKYFEYIQYVSDTLESFGIKWGEKIKKRVNKKWRNITYHYRSLSYVELLPLHEKWYPKDKKIIPKDIKLTPLTCRQWYIGDGGLSCIKRSHITLYTYGFSAKDVKWLVRELIKLKFKTTRRLANNVIGISVHSTKEFLEYISPCPVGCYQYKWNYQDNRKGNLILE